MNVNFLIFLVCFPFKLFYINTTRAGCARWRDWGKFHTEIALPVSHTAMPDLRGAEGLAHPHMLRISGCPRPGGPLYSPSHS